MKEEKLVAIVAVVMVLFLFSLVALAITDTHADSLASDACRAKGYSGGFSHFWTGDMFCTVSVEPVMYSFPVGTEIAPLEDVAK